MNIHKFLLSFFVIIWFISTNDSFGQTNLYPENISGLEIEFWVGSNPQPAGSYGVNIVSDKVIDGTKALKFDSPDASVPTGGHATAVVGGTTLPVGNIAITAGNYVFKTKIFIEGSAPAYILVYLTEQSKVITDGITLTIPLSEVEKGSWQTISHPVSFPSDIPDMKTGFRVRGMDYEGKTGASALHVDQMGLFAVEELIDTNLVYSPLLLPDFNWEINTAFSDEFNSGSLDPLKWNTDVGDWGTWSWEPENAYVKDTILTLRMKQQQHKRGGQDYYFTSGIAQIRNTITYGYFEARIKATDKGQGTCPAFWLYSVGQPEPTEEGGVQYSEIDAIEIFQIANQLKRLEMNLHTRIIENGVLTWKRPGQGDTELTHNSWDAPWDPRDDFHTYAVWNRPDSIFWYVDGIQRGVKKNHYWHLPMYLTVSLGLRTPYEKYIDGVRTVMPYPESTPEPGFPTEMYCDYVKVWKTPPQLYADKEIYQNAEYQVGDTLVFKSRYFAGSGETVLSGNQKGVICKLQEIQSDGTVVREFEQFDASAIGKESGQAIFKFSLAGLAPSVALPAGNQYVLKPVFNSSLEGGKEIMLKEGHIPVQILQATSTYSSLNKKSSGILSIYPNPAINQIKIQINTKFEPVTVQFYNAPGELVLQKCLGSKSIEEIDVSGWNRGLYFVKANSEVQKIIIQ